MARRRLTPEEEAKLVAEAEAVYAAGGFDPSELERVPLTIGPDLTMTFQVTFRFNREEMETIAGAAIERGVDVYEFLYRAARAAAGLSD